MAGGSALPVCAQDAGPGGAPLAAAPAYLPTPQRRALSAVARAASHGQGAEMRLAAAALAACLHQLGAAHLAGDTSQQQQQQQLGGLCGRVEWRRHVAVSEVQRAPHCLGGAGGAVLPGVCVPAGAASLGEAGRSWLHDHVPLALCLGAGEALGAARAWGEGAEEGVAVTVGVLEGGLGLLPPSTSQQREQQQQEEDRGEGEAAEQVPWWLRLGSGPHDSAGLLHGSGVVRVVRPCSLSPAVVGSADLALQLACQQVLGVLRPLGVRVLLLGAAFPQALAERLREVGGVCLAGPLPAATLGALAAACGTVPAAGLAALGTGHAGDGRGAAGAGEQLGRGVARVRACMVEVGAGQAGGGAPQGGAMGTWRGDPAAGEAWGLERLLVLRPEQQGAWPGGLQAVGAAPAAPAVSVLVADVTELGRRRRAHSVERCFRRLQACLVAGACLPGGGVYELLCAQALRGSGSSGEENGRGEGGEREARGSAAPAAWVAASQQARAEAQAWAGVVAARVAGCMEELVLALLQNGGLAYAQGAERLARAAALLQRPRCAGLGHGRGSGGGWPSAVLEAQRALHGCDGDGEDEDGMHDGTGAPRVPVVDALSARLHALDACLALVKQMVTADAHVCNGGGGCCAPEARGSIGRAGPRSTYWAVRWAGAGRCAGGPARTDWPAEGAPGLFTGSSPVARRPPPGAAMRGRAAAQALEPPSAPPSPEGPVCVRRRRRLEQGRGARRGWCGGWVAAGPKKRWAVCRATKAGRRPALAPACQGGPPSASSRCRAACGGTSRCAKSGRAAGCDAASGLGDCARSSWSALLGAVDSPARL